MSPDLATIDLLRHGDTGRRSYRGQIDDPLSALGWSQVRAAVEQRTCDRVVSSPLQRCAAFARELAVLRGVPLVLDVRLAEYHFGDWQGVPIETLAANDAGALQRFWADPLAYPPPGSEGMPAFRSRVCAALDDIAASVGSARVLVVTHGGVIRMLRCVVEDRPLRDMAGIEVPHASLHRIAWRVRETA
ncbi:MAG TPA: histidine phosphatase family protein [Rhodanobacteraceae bacterium]|jgi:alpha-ribazole phosphatase|nr:histidine phosphatase family protein [Rhodanobacteraceae bacterium]